MSEGDNGGFSRRQVLAATGAVAGAALLPQVAGAQVGRLYRRPNVLSNDGKTMLVHYRNAIRKMLDLPADDPRNWYRQAITHFLDCPHGNWWILPWHRGFTAQVEAIVRDISGYAEFAMPYWDWTAMYDPATKRSRVPDAMFDDVFDPNHEAYIGSWDSFRRRFEGPIEKTDYWTRAPGPQGDNPDAEGKTRYGQLLNRAQRFPADMWFDLHDNPQGLLFFEKGHAREGVTRASPWLDGLASDCVSPDTLHDALHPTDFLTFASHSAANHSQVAGFGILEGKPHNKVHNNVGGIISLPDGQGGWTRKHPYGQGFMQANLSPIDPLFFLHHSNLDRLWDVWTRKQQAQGGQILPDGYVPGQPPVRGSDYAAWSSEPFLFFVNGQGKPFEATAKTFQSMTPFRYVYEPGFGEALVHQPRRALAARGGSRPRQLAVETQPAAAAAAGLAVKVTPLLIQAAAPQAAGAQAAVRHYAKITVALPHSGHGALYNVEVHTGNPDAPVVVDTLSLFGHHTGGHGPLTFTVALGDTLRSLGRQKALRAGGTLHFRVRGESGHGHTEPVAATGGGDVLVHGVTIEAH